jgi:DNA-binding transcriptional ArsR family regulator
MTAARTYQLALHALGDPTRREIFERLSSGPLSVVHIAKDLPISRPAVSQHLKVLCEAKLVAMEKSGTRSMYRIKQEGIAAIREYLDKFWGDALANFKTLAEKTEREKNKEKTVGEKKQ